ncbi:hypothetical protein JCM24511_06265 [Saitozyma sp. JCM 24511]|nr:hypothetical protein JCM24511_06265 [Saitozyma sp. JCM 24511]
MQVSTLTGWVLIDEIWVHCSCTPSYFGVGEDTIHIAGAVRQPGRPTQYFYFKNDIDLRPKRDKKNLTPEGNQTPYRCALKWDWVIDPSLPATFSFCVLNMAGKDRKAEVTGLLEALDEGKLNVLTEIPAINFDHPHTEDRPLPVDAKEIFELGKSLLAGNVGESIKKALISVARAFGSRIIENRDGVIAYDRYVRNTDELRPGNEERLARDYWGPRGSQDGIAFKIGC